MQMRTSFKTYWANIFPVKNVPCFLPIMPLDIQFFGKLTFVGCIFLFYETWLIHFAFVSRHSFSVA